MWQQILDEFWSDTFGKIFAVFAFLVVCLFAFIIYGSVYLEPTYICPNGMFPAHLRFYGEVCVIPAKEKH